MLGMCLLLHLPHTCRLQVRILLLPLHTPDVTGAKLEVMREYCLCSIHHEERHVLGRGVRCGAHAPDDGGLFFNPVTCGLLEWCEKSLEHPVAWESEQSSPV